MKLTEEDCLSCGGCCFFEIQSAGKKHKGIEVGEDGWCKFYDEELKCTIHDEKPKICVDFEIGCIECIPMFMKQLKKKNSK